MVGDMVSMAMPPKTEWDREYNMVQSFNQIGSSEPRLKSHNRNVSFFVLLDVKNTPWRVSIDAPLTGLTLNYLAYISYLLSKQSQPRNFLLTHIIFDIVIMWDFIVCVNKMQLEKRINLQFNLNWKTNPLMMDTIKKEYVWCHGRLNLAKRICNVTMT